MANKHALLIGVDAYPHLDPQYQLAGCVNDAMLMRQLLVERFGFNDEAVVSLHNEAATRQAILEAMERLVEVARADDVVFFHFSGHGSRRRSASTEESSGKDSTIMPSDSGRDPLPNRDIVDDEIGAWLQRLSAKTRAISLVFDCCHSGTITRDPFAARVRAAPDDDRPPDSASRGATAAPSSARAVSSPGPLGRQAEDWQALGDDFVVMSGCRDEEYAHEFTDQRGGEVIRHGALTQYLSSALLAAGPDATYRDVFEAAATQVNTQFPAQHPRIEGAQDRLLFDERRVPTMRYVAVAEVDGEEVVLAGGAAHGLLPGSRWSVYPAGTKQATDAAALGTLLVQRVEALSARARLERVADGGEIAVGARCVEAAPSADHFRLALDLSALADDQRAPWRSALGRSSLLREGETPEASDLRVYALEQGATASAGDGVPAFDAVAEPAWSVVDRSGARVFRPRARADSEAIGALIENAETLARYRNALALANPDSALQVSFRLLREREGGWIPLGAGDPPLLEGDSVAFEFVNREPRAVFLSVLDFGLSGRVHLLYPPGTSSERVEAGQTLRIGCDKRRIRLGLPPGFEPDRGTETFKALVSSGEADFSWLQQKGTRAAPVSPSRLRQMFEAAYHGPAMRDACLEPEPAADDDWCAIGCAFELRRCESPADSSDS